MLSYGPGPMPLISSARFRHIKPSDHDKVIAYAMLLGVEAERKVYEDGEAWSAEYTMPGGVGYRTMNYAHRIVAVCWALHHMGWFVTADGELTRDES